jgi:hypothetical protein
LTLPLDTLPCRPIGCRVQRQRGDHLDQHRPHGGPPELAADASWHPGSFAVCWRHHPAEGDRAMLFVTYWELNEAMDVRQRLEIAEKLTTSGLFPPEGVTVVRWDGTPDGWGILIVEAERVEDVQRALDLWRVSGAGFFKSTRTAPAMPIQQMIPASQAVIQAVDNG